MARPSSPWMVTYCEEPRKDTGKPLLNEDGTPETILSRHWILRPDYVVPPPAYDTWFPIDLSVNPEEAIYYLLTRMHLIILQRSRMATLTKVRSDTGVLVQDIKLTKVMTGLVYTRFWQAQDGIVENVLRSLVVPGAKRMCDDISITVELKGGLGHPDEFGFPNIPDPEKKKLLVGGGMEISDDSDEEDTGDRGKLVKEKLRPKGSVRFACGIDIAHDMPDPLTNSATSRFWKLDGADFKLCYNNGGFQQPSEAYIKIAELSLMNSSYDWTRVPFRDELGQLKWMELKNGSAAQRVGTWDKYYTQGTTAAEFGWKARCINPVIKLTIVRPGTGRLTLKELENIFKEAVGSRNQTFEVTEKQGDTQILLGVSPFGDYETWIDADIHQQYLKCRPDREMPRTIKMVNDACKRLQNHDKRIYNKDHETQSIDLSALKILTAQGTRKNLAPALKSQRAIMGGSAALIAGVLLWDGLVYSTERVQAKSDTTTANDVRVGWPATGVYPAEWLHRFAYSWGGISETPDVFDFKSSQDSKNLIFGTSETNSIMTQYEQAWQYLILAEQKYCDTYMPGVNQIAGTLTTARTGYARVIRTAGKQSSLTEEWAAGPDNGHDDWRGLAREARASWLCFALNYQMELKSQSYLLYGPLVWKTTFYPFQRPFFTSLEASADKIIMEVLINKAQQRAIIGNTQDRQERIEEEPSGEFIQITTSKNDDTNQYQSRVLAPNIVIQRLDPVIDNLQTNIRHRHGKLDKKSPILPKEPEQQLIKISPYSSPKTKPVYHGDKSPAHEDLWTAIMSSPSNIEINGIVLHKPQLACLDAQATIIKLAPELLGIGDRGQVILPEELIADAKQLKGLSSHIENAVVALPIKNIVTVSGVASNTSHPPGGSAIIPVAPSEFTVAGHITLFGVISADLYTSHGSSINGVSERVIINGELSLGTFIPSLAGSPLDMLKVCNTTLTYRDTMTESHLAGLKLSTEMKLDGALDSVNDVLHGVFGMTEPSIHVSGMLSMNRDWTEILAPIGFNLRSELRNMSMKLFDDHVEVVNLGIDVMGTRTVRQADTGRVTRGYNMGIGFFGAALVTVGEGAPIRGKWYMLKHRDLHRISINVANDEWKDLFGIAALDLQDVLFSASFSSLVGIKSTELHVQASLTVRSATIVLAGHYSKSNWSISGNINDVSLTTILNMYEDLFGSILLDNPQDYNIVFNSICLVIGSEGFFLQGTVTVNGPTSTSATISIAKNGISIGGAVGDLELFDGLVKIHEAELDVFIGRAIPEARSRDIKVAVSGHVTIKDLIIKAGLYYVRNAAGENQYTVYGEISGALKLRQLCSELQGTFLDVELTNIAFFVSNQDTPAVGALNSMKYPIKKGVQICATIDNIDGMKTLTKSTATELQLCAAWSGDAFAITIIYRPEDGIRFTDNISAGPLELGVRLGADPSIFVAAGLTVKVQKQIEPLRFQLGLSVGVQRAKGSASLETPWKNPFGIGEDIEVGSLTITIGIDYKVFAATGIPSPFAFGGYLKIGQSTGAVLLQIDPAAPTQQLITASFTNLDFSEILSFAAKRVGFSLPIPPDCKVLVFKVLSLYLSTGAELGGKKYPAGVSLISELILFNHNAKVEAVFKEGEFKIHGRIDSFQVGGLTVSGALPGTCPLILIHFTSGTQIVRITGAVDFLGTGASIDLAMSMQPETRFDFNLNVQILGVMNVLFKAHMVPGSVGDPKDMDFILEAAVENNVLEELVRTGNEYITSQDHTGNKEDDLHRAVVLAKIRMDAAEAEGQDLEDRVIGAKNQEMERVQTETERLQTAAHEAKDAYDNKVGTLEANLQAERQMMENGLLLIRKENEETIRVATDKLQQLRWHEERVINERNTKWGSLLNHQKKVVKECSDIQVDLAAMQREVARQEDALPKLDRMVLLTAFMNLQSARSQRDDIEKRLRVRQAVCKQIDTISTDPNFIIAQRDIQTAEEALSERNQRAIDDEAIERQRLEDFTRRHDHAVRDATSDLHKFQDSNHLQDAAEKAFTELNTFKSTSALRLMALEKAVDDLTESPQAMKYVAAHRTYDDAVLAMASYDPLWELVKTAAATGATLMVGQLRRTMIVQIRKMSIKGRLKGMILHNKPLIASVVFEIFGQRLPALEMDYSLLDPTVFLTSFWKKILDLVTDAVGLAVVKKLVI